ncbi:hypothetical protein AB0E01_42290 [Nocardia vinacea]|uniref:hypothetical protein n=1 Tax=Nocardia vinacea TaxID=96468 RepID=UPI0033EA5A43
MFVEVLRHRLPIVLNVRIEHRPYLRRVLGGDLDLSIDGFEFVDRASELSDIGSAA